MHDLVRQHCCPAAALEMADEKEKPFALYPRKTAHCGEQ